MEVRVYGAFTTGLLTEAYAHHISDATTADSGEAMVLRDELERRGVDPSRIQPAPLDDDALASLYQQFCDAYASAVASMASDTLRECYVRLITACYKDFADIIQAELSRRDVLPPLRAPYHFD